jgi:hypothetical protein
MRYTKFCVMCLKKKAAVWCGYILDGHKSILAGWCNACYQSEESTGFVGHYKKKMKILED